MAALCTAELPGITKYGNATHFIVHRADSDGTLRLAEAAPVSGSYDEVEMKWIAEDGVVSDYFSPDTDEELPGLILLHGAPARRMNLESMVLASHGYRVFAPLHFQPENDQQLEDRLEDVSDLPETLDERPIEYVQDAIEWLRSRPDVTDVPVGDGLFPSCKRARSYSPHAAMPRFTVFHMAFISQNPRLAASAIAIPVSPEAMFATAQPPSTVVPVLIM